MRFDTSPYSVSFHAHVLSAIIKPPGADLLQTRRFPISSIRCTLFLLSLN